MRLHLGRLRREPEERPRDLAAAQVLGSAADVWASGRDTGGRDGHVPHGSTDLGMELVYSVGSKDISSLLVRCLIKISAIYRVINHVLHNILLEIKSGVACNNLHLDVTLSTC